MIREHPDVQQFLAAVVRPVRASALHADIQQELLQHLEELADAKEDEGAAREEAIRWAIAQMGDPVQVGQQLNRIHRPRLNWTILLGVIALALFGLFSMFVVERNLAETRPQLQAHLVMPRVATIGIGLLVLVSLYYFRYELLRRYAKLLYIVVLIGSYILQRFGDRINGIPMLHLGPILVDWSWISVYLLLIAAAAWLVERADTWRQWLTELLLFVCVPAMLFLNAPRLACLFLYLAGYFVVRLLVTRQWVKTLVQIVIPSGLGILMLFNDYLYRSRFETFLRPEEDARGTGYMYVQMKHAIASAGWWGHGFASHLPTLPIPTSENIAAYLIYCFGWFAGIAFAVLGIWFIVQLIRTCLSIKDGFGKALLGGMATMLIVQFGYNGLMTLGFAPLIAVPLPFVNNSSFGMLLEFAAAGLMLAVYRRKHMIPLRQNRFD